MADDKNIDVDREMDLRLMLALSRVFEVEDPLSEVFNTPDAWMPQVRGLRERGADNVFQQKTDLAEEAIGHLDEIRRCIKKALGLDIIDGDEPAE